MNRKIISTTLIIIGLICIVYPKIGELYINYQQQRLIKGWKESLPIIDEINDDENIDNENRLNEVDENKLENHIDNKNKENSKKKHTKDNMEGILNIEKIKLSLPILKGATKKNLSISLASLENTGHPGEIGNYAIAGHRSHTYGRNFNRLDEVEVGDIIEVNKGKEDYKYIVSEKIYVKPEETWVLYNNNEDKEITLITCHPMINPTHRLIVKGKIQD